MLEHNVLRKMNDGGRCIMSKMELAGGIARAGDTRCRGSHNLVLFVKTCVFLRPELNLAPEILKSDKIDCQNPRAKLGIGKLRSPVLTGHRKQHHYLARAQTGKRALRQANGVLLKSQRGAFWKSVQPQFLKLWFFLDRRHFLKKV